MQQAPEEMMSVEEFARKQRIWADQAIKMIQDGYYSGRLVGDQWFVDRAELSKPPKPPSETKILQSVVIGALGVVIFLAMSVLFEYYVRAFNVEGTERHILVRGFIIMTALVFWVSGLKHVFRLFMRKSKYLKSREALISYVALFLVPFCFLTLLWSV